MYYAMSKNREALLREMDVISFSESELGLGMKLLPVQKFILKMFYGLPLDGDGKSIELPNVMNTEKIGDFTEKEFLQYLIDTGRTNVVSYSEGYRPTELLLNAGRRSTKSIIEGIICGYELYRLMNKRNPQAYYGMTDGTEISVSVASCNKEQSATFKDMMMKGCIPQSWLGDRIVSKNSNSFAMKGRNESSIKFLSDSYRSSSIYGNSNIAVVMDEMAFFKDGKQAYERLTPSVVSFTKKDGEKKPIGDGEGKVVMASSPFYKDGKFYEKYVESFAEPDRTLMFDMYSTMLNPTIDSGFLRDRKNENPIIFANEFEAVFID